MSTSGPKMNSLRAAILIVSDTASQDPGSDKAADALNSVFEKEGSEKWQLTSNGQSESKQQSVAVKIVPDDKTQIQNAIIAWTDGDDFVNLIVTTGGTGFTPKDVTPEAVAPILHRQAPGLVHGVLASSFKITPFAMMSRPVAGVRNKTIIVTLPGSPKGAKENLEAIIKLLPHACLQAAGENSRTAHAGGTAKLEKDAGLAKANLTSNEGNHIHSHDHSHGHTHKHDHSHGHGHKIPKAHTKPSERPAQSNDPRLGASHRARQSPYPMLSVADAIHSILENTPDPTSETRPFSTDLVGCVISSDITAAEAVPAYRASIVDGYAVIVPEDESQRHVLKGTFPVASVSHAQASSMPPPLQSGEIARITTGAPLPENANAVVMVEDTVIASLTTSTNSDTSTEEEKEVTILTDALTPGENIREPGSDISHGSTILTSGTRISPLGGEIGVLAASGTQAIPIFRRPRLGVLSTGDEVTDIIYTDALTGGMIRDSNRPSLLTLIRSWHLCDAVIDLGIARDTPHSELETKLRDAYRIHDLDIVVTTGGVSMGELDLLKPTIERSMGGTIHFGRVNMKPGKPTTFATIPLKPASSTSSSSNNNASTQSSSSARQMRLIFALPGNPASALVTANLFLLPSLQKLAGLPESRCHGLERVQVKLAGSIKCDKSRPEYHRCSVSFEFEADGGSSGDAAGGGAGGRGVLVARSTGMQRSSRVGSVGGANGLLCLPAKEGGLDGGEWCDCLLMGPLAGL